MKSEPITYDVKAYITLLPTDKGGRKKGVSSGYKPSISFNSGQQYCAEIALLDKTQLQPGQSTDVNIKLLPSTTIGEIKLFDSFTILEGNKPVGSGIVMQLIVDHDVLVNA